MEIGITYHLRSEVELPPDAPPDALSEYDSIETIDAIADVLRRHGHTPRYLGDGPALLRSLLERPVDLVFTFSAGSGGRSREVRIPAALELLGIPYTHSDAVTMALARDKSIAKRIVASWGIPTPAFQVVERIEDLENLHLEFPVMAKPTTEGTSMGVANDGRCDDISSLERHVQRMLKDYRQPILVEAFCPGPEFTVAILGTGEKAHVLGCSEFRGRKVPIDRFVYSSEAKVGANSQELVEILTPPPRDETFLAPIKATALAAYRALGCRDIGRVDIRLDAHGRPMFLELNAIPGMVPNWSDIVLIAQSVGWTWDQLIMAVVESACERLPATCRQAA